MDRVDIDTNRYYREMAEREEAEEARKADYYDAKKESEKDEIFFEEMLDSRQSELSELGYSEAMVDSIIALYNSLPMKNGRRPIMNFSAESRAWDFIDALRKECDDYLNKIWEVRNGI